MAPGEQLACFLSANTLPKFCSRDKTGPTSQQQKNLHARGERSGGAGGYLSQPRSREGFPFNLGFLFTYSCMLKFLNS